MIDRLALLLAVGAQAPPRRHVRRRRARRRVPRRHARARRHARRQLRPPVHRDVGRHRRRRAQRDRCSTTTLEADPSPRPDRRVARRHDRRRRRRRRRRAPGRRLRPAARRRRRPDRRQRSAPPGRQLGRRPRAQPVPARRGPGARGAPTRSSSTAARPTAGDLHVGDRTVVQTPAAGRRRRSSASPRSATRTASARRRSPRSPSTPRRSTCTRQRRAVSTILVARRADGVADATSCATASPACCPTASRRSPATELADERLDQPPTFLGMIRTFLVVFAGIALVVATLSINNTFTITVAQRTRELALLRAVGASRRQVRRSVATRGAGRSASSRRSSASSAGLGVAGLLKGMFDAFGFALPAGGLDHPRRCRRHRLRRRRLATLLAAQLAGPAGVRGQPAAALRDAAARAGGDRPPPRRRRRWSSAARRRRGAARRPARRRVAARRARRGRCWWRPR